MLGIADRSQLNAAFGKASRGAPNAVRDAAHDDISQIKIQGEPVWHLLQSKGQTVDAHDMADLLRCIDAVVGDGASFDSLRRFVHTPTTDGADDDDVLPSMSLGPCFASSACCPPQRGPCSPTSSVNVMRGWRLTAPTLL